MILHRRQIPTRTPNLRRPLRTRIPRLRNRNTAIRFRIPVLRSAVEEVARVSAVADGAEAGVGVRCVRVDG